MLTVTADQLPRVMACNGSRLMPPAYPSIDDDRTARDEGIAAHWMAQQSFIGIPIETLINTKAPNGFVLTSEMAEHVMSYLSALDYCGEMETVTDWTGSTRSAFHIGGRCDHRAWRPEINTLFIDDFKYGHRLVEPFEHWTLISHAISTCLSLNIAPAVIALRIHQPRPYHPDGKTREWRLSYGELNNYGQRIIATLGDPSDTLATGPQCAKCHALGDCPAARAASMNAIDATTAVFSDQLPADALAWELDTLRQAQSTVENRLEALEELAAHRIRNGAVIPNYAMQSRYANNRWKSFVTPETIIALTGKNLSKPGLDTPAAAKRAGIPENVINALTERPLTGTKLVRVSADTQARRMLNK